jgi:hypothetical protein
MRPLKRGRARHAPNLVLIFISPSASRLRSNETETLIEMKVLFGALPVLDIFSGDIFGQQRSAGGRALAKTGGRSSRAGCSCSSARKRALGAAAGTAGPRSARVLPRQICMRR